MGDKKHWSTIAKYLSGEMSPDEVDIFLNWLAEEERHQALFEEALALWEKTDKSVPKKWNTTHAWDLLKNNIDDIDTSVIPMPKTNQPVWKKQLLRIVAIFFIGIIGFWVIQNISKSEQQVSYQTDNAEQKQITLPDGSKIWLNANSKATYYLSFSPRLVQFEGEGFFEIVHNKKLPFEIESGTNNIKVLGTSFNVRAYPKEKEMEVNVTNGKVAFSKIHDSQLQLILTAGETGIYTKENKKLTKLEKTVTNATAWKTKELIFSNTTMDEVVKVLKRYFNINIQTENPSILKCHITGQYRQPQLEQILEVLEFSLEIKVEKINETFLLSGEGCE